MLISYLKLRPNEKTKPFILYLINKLNIKNPMRDNGLHFTIFYHKGVELFLDKEVKVNYKTKFEENGK